MNASWFVAGKRKLFPWPRKLIQGPHQLNPHLPTPNQWGWLSFLLTHSSPGFTSQLVPQVKNGSRQNPRSLGIRALHMVLWEAQRESSDPLRCSQGLDLLTGLDSSSLYSEMGARTTVEVQGQLEAQGSDCCWAEGLRFLICFLKSNTSGYIPPINHVSFLLNL